MRYTIAGADKESGNDVKVVVNAITRIEAEHIANTRGILVSAITAMDKEADEGPIAMDGDPFEAEKPAAAGNGHETPAVPAGAPPAEVPHSQITALSQQSFGAIEHGDYVEYKIAHNPSVMLLTIAVNHMIKEGWELQGGVCTCIINNAPNFFQAVIKHPVRKE